MNREFIVFFLSFILGVLAKSFPCRRWARAAKPQKC